MNNMNEKQTALNRMKSTNSTTSRDELERTSALASGASTGSAKHQPDDMTTRKLNNRNYEEFELNDDDDDDDDEDVADDDDFNYYDDDDDIDIGDGDDDDDYDQNIPDYADHAMSNAKNHSTNSQTTSAAIQISNASYTGTASNSKTSQQQPVGGVTPIQYNEKNTSLLSSSMKVKRSNYDLDDEFKYEVLTPEKIVQHMIECIKEVNQILELSSTTARILLHHFKWDKEKLMERFYDSDQETLFKEAHIVSPFKPFSNTKRVSVYSR